MCLRAQLAARDGRIDLLLVQIAELTTQVQALVLRLSKDSSTSSKPPSSDGPGKRPRGAQTALRTLGAGNSCPGVPSPEHGAPGAHGPVRA
ncbi:DUF6444 domain-containing protein [Streptomyces sp. NPDC057456]|uniref:DUF6444 domain-containing protein n=1 Tax=Streptomyces sp. NPDC057456 TaxID=3346139 RepID=UPI00369949AF